MFIQQLFNLTWTNDNQDIFYDTVFVVPTSGLQPFLGVEVCFQHSFIEQHVAHGFRYNGVHRLRDLHILHLPWDYNDLLGHFVLGN